RGPGSRPGSPSATSRRRYRRIRPVSNGPIGSVSRSEGPSGGRRSGLGEPLRLPTCRLPASPAGAPAEPAREDRDQPDQREHGRDDEQPVDRESHAEGHDCQQREDDEKQHDSESPLLARIPDVHGQNGRDGSAVTGAGVAPGGSLGSPSTLRSVEFTQEEVERARRYHRPLYLGLGADLLLGVAVLVLVATGPVGDAVYG